MQSVSSRIWTRVAKSISYDDNHYTADTSYFPLLQYQCFISKHSKQFLSIISNSAIWLIKEIQTSAVIPGQSGLGIRR